jgi:hypothetical protein
MTRHGIESAALSFLLSMAAAVGAAAAPQPHQAPQGKTHDQHQKPASKEAELKKHGDMAMGFDQDKVVHHFRISAQGGTVEVTAKDAADVASRDAIRAHLKQIATAFSEGDFEKPMMTHGEEPPGIPAMKRMRNEIAYKYEDVPAGGRVVITTRNKEALAAVHEFLKYQITEHKTGDPMK